MRLGEGAFFQPFANETPPGTVEPNGLKQAAPLRGASRLRYIPRNWQQRWKLLRRAAGFPRWVPDVCRHTFASYHAAHFRNLPELQLEMGHRDCSLLRSRYVAPARRHDAEGFWLRLGLPVPNGSVAGAAGVPRAPVGPG